MTVTVPGTTGVLTVIVITFEVPLFVVTQGELETILQLIWSPLASVEAGIVGFCKAEANAAGPVQE